MFLILSLNSNISPMWRPNLISLICPTILANKVCSFEVLSDYSMGSDHDPMCILRFDSAYKLDSNHKADPRFNFFKADW